MTRIEQISARLPDHTAALICAPYHLRYLTGFPSGDSFLLITRDVAYFLTDFRYIEAAEKTVSGAVCRMFRTLSEELQSLITQHNITELWTEAAECSVAQLTAWQNKLSDVNVTGSADLDAWLGELRLIKTAEEIRCIERAQTLAEAGFDHILSYIREGVTEWEVALELEFYMRRQGAERAAFDIIVASGTNGSLPHAIPTDKPLCRGDFITMDFGAVVDGYHSDMTRTVALGNVSEEQKHIYDTVLKAQTAALSVVRDGLPCIEGDAAARRIIESAGYGDCFGHGTGHGVGVQIHENPRLSLSAGDTVLRAGNVVTVEPGIYLAGRYGVRIEDMALITADGCRNLTHAPKELLCL